MDLRPIIFTVPGDPVSWKRPGVGGKRRFTDRKDGAYRDTVGWHGAAAMRGREPLNHTCGMRLTIRRKIPNRTSRVTRAAMLDGRIRPGMTPDSSNVLKGIEDALNGVCYRDDALICHHTIDKIYAELPGVEVVIWPVGEVDHG